MSQIVRQDTFWFHSVLSSALVEIASLQFQVHFIFQRPPISTFQILSESKAWALMELTKDKLKTKTSNAKTSIFQNTIYTKFVI